MRCFWTCPAFVALLAATAGCVSGEPEVGTRLDRIVGGEADSAHPAVVALVRRSDAGICTGTLITRRLVLTAAHCVDGVAVDDLTVHTGPDLRAPLTSTRVLRVDLYPGFTGSEEDRLGGIDLAALELERELDLEPIKVRTVISDQELAAASVTLVGYGVTDGSSPLGRGERRAVVAPVRGVCSRMIRVGGAEQNACTGDSGGPVLLGGELVAVVSSGRDGCGAPSSHTRLGAHASWIARVLAGQLDSPCPSCLAPDVACDAPVDAPTSAATGEDDGGCAFRATGSARATSAGMMISTLLAASTLRRRARRHANTERNVT